MMNWRDRTKTAGIILACFLIGVFSRFCFLYCSHHGNAVHHIKGIPLTQSAFECLVSDVESSFNGVHCLGFPSLGDVYILDENGKLGFPRMKVMRFVSQRVKKRVSSKGSECQR